MMKEPMAKIIKDTFLKFNVLEEQKKISHEFLFILTSKCNLNCTNCSVFCGLREPFELKLEDFTQQLINLREQIPVSFVSFCGGEPTLHPQFMDFCKELFSQIPDCFLQIITNGTLLNTFSEEDLQFLNKYNVSFAITLYPKKKIINIVKNFEEKCNKNYPNIDVSFKGVRPYFGKYDYNYYGTNDPEDFYYFCEKSHQSHSFVIFDNRLYNCCISPAYSAIDLPKDKEDSLSINQLPSYDDVLNFGNHCYDSCRYCTANRTIGQPLHFWHQQSDVPSCYFGSLLDLYMYNYDLYYKLLHTFGEIPECLEDEYFLSKEASDEYNFCDPIGHFKKRFTDGILDVLIPFDNEYNIIKYKDLLHNQSKLEKCNIYFIGINTNPKAESAVYNTFIPLNDNKNSFWYLKANTFQEGLEIFTKNSFLNTKLVLTDYDLLLDNNLFIDEKHIITTSKLQESCRNAIEN